MWLRLRVQCRVIVGPVTWSTLNPENVGWMRSARLCRSTGGSSESITTAFKTYALEPGQSTICALMTAKHCCQKGEFEATGEKGMQKPEQDV